MRVLITGGAGFIGGAMVRKLLSDQSIKVFNLDKLSYASDLTSIDQFFENNNESYRRYCFQKVDLANSQLTTEAVLDADPDLVFHFAAETHVDRSIDRPATFFDSNVTGTLNLLEAVRKHWQSLPIKRKENFRFHHVSTDEVFGSLGKNGSFSETSIYNPRSPYSASKAASDHIVRAWHHTYGLPTLITNCSNNFGPWQFPEKLIPLVILKALKGEAIPIYGDGSNVRDWLFIDDHIDALLVVAKNGILGESYCIGGNGERTNKNVVEQICALLDLLQPSGSPYSRLINYVRNRPGHDHRYAINPSKINSKLGWKSKNNFEKRLEETVRWYIQNQHWCRGVFEKSGYFGERIGVDL